MCRYAVNSVPPLCKWHRSKTNIFNSVKLFMMVSGQKGIWGRNRVAHIAMAKDQWCHLPPVPFTFSLAYVKHCANAVSSLPASKEITCLWVSPYKEILAWQLLRTVLMTSFSEATALVVWRTDMSCRAINTWPVKVSSGGPQDRKMLKEYPFISTFVSLTLLG